MTEIYICFHGIVYDTMKANKYKEPQILLEQTKKAYKTLEDGRNELTQFILLTSESNNKGKVARAGKVDPKNFASKMRLEQRHCSALFLARWAARVKKAERRGELTPVPEAQGGKSRDELALLIRKIRNAQRFRYDPANKEALADFLFQLETENVAAANRLAAWTVYSYLVRFGCSLLRLAQLLQTTITWLSERLRRSRKTNWSKNSREDMPWPKLLDKIGPKLFPDPG